MKIQINFGDVQKSDALVDHVESQLRHSLKRFEDRITRLEVHLRDVNAKKAGLDKHCTVEVRPAGQQPFVVEAQDNDLYRAIRDAAEKAERAVTHKFEKQDAHR